MSFGIAEPACGEDNEINLTLFCQALALAEERDLVLTASPGNNKTDIEFPANDTRVMSIGGIEPDGSFWDDAPDCPYPSPTLECGSNYGAEQDLVAPAKTVLSTVYAGFDHNVRVQCGDSFLEGEDGYGPCTGTSMSSPYVAGIAGILRSVNPLLSNDAIRDALITTASHAANPNDQFGFGIPDAGAAVQKTLGKAAGSVLSNRLTPLFSLYSLGDQTHVYTVSPQAASAFIFHPDQPFESVGPAVLGYLNFPGVSCTVSPCETWPRASVYLFTTETSPFPETLPLVPLFRLRYDPNLPNRCVEPPPPRIDNRDFSYTTEDAGIVHFKENVVDTEGIGYELDGREGYIFKVCEPEPECIPEGAERLYRLYHPIRDDYAIFPESELEDMQEAGYISQVGLADWIGYAYPNVDSDGDYLIDGFELLIGTDPSAADTDCDGVGDGEEILNYDLSDPDPANHGYRDPLDGACYANIFADGFETGDTSQWSLTGTE